MSCDLRHWQQHCSTTLLVCCDRTVVQYVCKCVSVHACLRARPRSHVHGVFMDLQCVCVHAVCVSACAVCVPAPVFMEEYAHVQNVCVPAHGFRCVFSCACASCVSVRTFARACVRVRGQCYLPAHHGSGSLPFLYHVISNTHSPKFAKSGRESRTR